MYATTLSDTDSSNSNSEEIYDGEGNYSAFITIVPMQSLDDLSVLVEELGEHIELELMGIVEESNNEKVKEQWDYKKPTIPFLRKPVNMKKWLK